MASRYSRKRRLEPTPPKLACSVCDGSDPKYKCPKCRLNYCSVDCCRQHKLVCQPSTATTPSTAVQLSKYAVSDEILGHYSSRPSAEPRDSYEDMEEGWRLTQSMLDNLHESDYVRGELEGNELRKLIRSIASTSNTVGRNGKETEQERLLTEVKTKCPAFATFLDKLLVVAGVLERQDTAVSQEEWLASDGSGSLVLKPLPRKVKPVLPQDAASSSTDESTSGSSSEDSDDSSSSNAGDSD